MGLFGKLFKDKLTSLAKEISKEIYEYSFHTVSILISSNQNLPDEYENSNINWEKVNNENIKRKIVNEFQYFILYAVSRQALNLLSKQKYKKFLDTITETMINKTPHIQEKIFARRFQEYIQYEIIPINENMESAPEEIENSAVGRFAYHLSKILGENISPISDGVYLFNLVIIFLNSKNIQERISKL